MHVFEGTQEGLKYKSYKRRYDRIHQNNDVIHPTKLENSDRTATFEVNPKYWSDRLFNQGIYYGGLGQTLGAGDFDGDGTDDLVMGYPGEDLGTTVDGGQVAIIYDSALW